MKEQLNILLKNLEQETVSFKEVIEFIETYYQHHPTSFRNGDVENEATQNQGSAKVFAFAEINNLSKEDTLALFAEHYHAVLDEPEATSHQNIRQFIRNGWPGIAFEGKVLTAK
jgi:hypothetical protein